MVASWPFAQVAIAQDVAVPPLAEARIISRFDDPAIARLLLDLGASWRTDPPASPGDPAQYRVSLGSGMNFTLAPSDCSVQEGCRALVLVAVFEGVSAPNEAELDAFLHRFNDSVPSAKVFRSPEGAIILQAYVNAAGGITVQNFAAHLIVFRQDIVTLSQSLAALGQAR